MNSQPVQFIFPDWRAPRGVRAAFSLRGGGVSAAPYDTLNLGGRIGDTPQAVAENRRRVRVALDLPAEPFWLEQVHGAEVVEVPLSRAGQGDEQHQADAGRAATQALDEHRPVADAVVARRPGAVCAIRVADCMPVLFAARDGSVVGAAHAGWRGLAGGVLEATICELGVPGAQLIAWMGPAIGPQSFEVGDDVRAAFMASDTNASSAFVPNSRGRWQCDLYALARRKLEQCGVAEISGGGWCTFADRERFFSYRRDGQCGRMAALIWMDGGGVGAGA